MSEQQQSYLVRSVTEKSLCYQAVDCHSWCLTTNSLQPDNATIIIRLFLSPCLIGTLTDALFFFLDNCFLFWLDLMILWIPESIILAPDCNISAGIWRFLMIAFYFPKPIHPFTALRLSTSSSAVCVSVCWPRVLAVSDIRMIYHLANIL